MNDRPEPLPAAEAARFNALLRGRRTVHDFLPDPVPQAVLERALEAARWAPNHHRTEPWRFYLLGARAQALLAERNAELTRAKSGERAAEVKLARWRAVPHWLLLTVVIDADEGRAREDYAACCCAAQNLMLALWAEGIGSKWTTGGVTRDADTLRALGIDPAVERVVGLFWYGVPANVQEQQRRPLEQCVRALP